MPHSFSYAVSMNLEHSIKERSHERYPDHFQCFRNIKKKIKCPDFQAMTFTNIEKIMILDVLNFCANLQRETRYSQWGKTCRKPPKNVENYISHVHWHYLPARKFN